MLSHSSYHQRLPRNTVGRDFVIGDIHAHFSRVERELERIGFDPRKDRLICCGDLVDRGPESARAAEWLDQPWFFAVMGNHDASVLQRCGLLSAKFELWHDYHGWLKDLDAGGRQRLQDSLAALPWALEVETAAGVIGVVHAEVPERFAHWREFLDALDEEDVRSLASSNRYLARQSADWGTPGIENEYRLQGVDWAIHGHTPRRGCLPGRLGNRLWIDTCGWYDHTPEVGTPRFTIVDVNDPLTPL